jgi:hypothetical protein
LVVVESAVADAGPASDSTAPVAAASSAGAGAAHGELAVSAPASPPSVQRRGEGEYTPALGFRCLIVGESACAIQIRPLAFDWKHVDVHADLFLGGYEGGDFGIGVGSRYLRLGGPSSDLGLVFRWDFDVLVIRTAAVETNPLLEVALQSGPKFGLSWLMNQDVALETTLNGGMVVGYGIALNSGGASQAVVDGYLGLLIGVRF